MADNKERYDDTRAAVEAYEKWIASRGPLGAGATADRPFMAGWIAGRRAPAIGAVPELPEPAGQMNKKTARELEWPFQPGWSAEQVEQIRRDGIAADRRARTIIIDSRVYTADEIKGRIVQQETDLKQQDELIAKAGAEIADLRAQLAAKSQGGAQLDKQADEVSKLSNSAIQESARAKPAELASVIACARRVYRKFGADSDWSEWRDLGDALAEFDAAPTQSGAQPQGENT